MVRRQNIFDQATTIAGELQPQSTQRSGSGYDYQGTTDLNGDGVIDHQDSYTHTAPHSNASAVERIQQSGIRDEVDPSALVSNPLRVAQNLNQQNFLRRDSIDPNYDPNNRFATEAGFGIQQMQNNQANLNRNIDQYRGDLDILNLIQNGGQTAGQRAFDRTLNLGNAGMQSASIGAGLDAGSQYMAQFGGNQNTLQAKNQREQLRQNEMSQARNQYTEGLAQMYNLQNQVGINEMAMADYNRNLSQTQDERALLNAQFQQQQIEGNYDNWLAANQAEQTMYGLAFNPLDAYYESGVNALIDNLNYTAGVEGILADDRAADQQAGANLAGQALGIFGSFIGGGKG